MKTVIYTQATAKGIQVEFNGKTYLATKAVTFLDAIKEVGITLPSMDKVQMIVHPVSMRVEF